jgi:hypothetical protein
MLRETDMTNCFDSLVDILCSEAEEPYHVRIAQNQFAWLTLQQLYWDTFEIKKTDAKADAQLHRDTYNKQAKKA